MRGFLSFLTACIATAQCADIAKPHAIRAAPTVSLVYQFPTNGSWIENIAVRSNGKILATRSDVPELWSIDPSSGLATLVNTFLNVTGLHGITEISPDIFVILAGTSDAWKVDMNPSPPRFNFITSILEAKAFNGATTFDNRGTVLIADSSKGVIWRLDTNTKSYSMAISDPTMVPPATPRAIGVNGVKVFDGYVYYSSSTQQLLCRVPVNASASPTSPVEILATGFNPDDFILTSNGTAYVAANVENMVLEVSLQDQVSVIAGSTASMVVAGPTACEFGHTGNSQVLYVSTCGGQAMPVNGTTIEPGKIVQITGLRA